jgi:hypothetical protein
MFVAGGGASKLLLLCNSSKIVDDTGGNAPMKTLRLLDNAVCDLEKQPSSSLKKTSTISERVVQAPLETLSKKGLHNIFFFLGSRFNISYNFCIFLASLV